MRYTQLWRRVGFPAVVWRALCAVVCALAPGGRGRAAEAVPDLDDVVGIEVLKASPAVRDAARALLKRNGFVVLPHFQRQIFSPYIACDLPAFVTTDSVHRTFHVIFEEQLQKLETHMAGEVASLTRGMVKRLEALPPPASREETDAHSLALRFFRVGTAIMDGRAPEQAPDGVRRELGLILGAAGRAPSPLFGYEMDYSDFAPRGFYTRSEGLRAFFRAMSWYGNCAFRLVSDRETRAAMTIANTLAAENELLELWRKIDATYTSLLGASDDLTPAEYAAVLGGLQKQKGKADLLGRFRREAAELRDPAINSMVVDPANMPRWRELTKGMRFLGKRYLPDSAVFMHLTHPAVPTRGFPCGLDFMAANGSARAEERLRTKGAFQMKGYREGMAAAGRLVGQARQAESRSHYADFLRLIETLWAPPPEAAAPFLKTRAYGDKALMTALAAWASMRHTWQLQGKYSVMYLGLFERDAAGYVEPNLAFFDRLDELVLRTIALLRPAKGADIDRLIRFRQLVASLRSITEKQLSGKPLSDPEKQLLKNYGLRIASLAYFELNSSSSEKLLPWMSLVADVHCEHLWGEVLQVGTGGALPIYVVVPYQGRQHLMVGGVYSYYEFRQPIGDRLTDDAWQRRFGCGDLPPLPSWASSFIVGADTGPLLERLRKGERVWELRYLPDPRIERILKEGLAPGGVFAQGPARPFAVELYGLKAGRKAMPFLLERVASTDEQEARAAAGILWELVGEQDIPELQHKALTLKPEAASRYAGLIGAVSARSAQKALGHILRESREERVRETVAWALRAIGSKAETEALLDYFPPAQREFKAAPNRPPTERELERARIVAAIGRIWAAEGHRGRRSQLPTDTLPPQEEQRVRRRVIAFMVECLRCDELGVALAAHDAVASMKLDEAVPALEDLVKDFDTACDVARTLRRTGTPAALAGLVRLLGRKLEDPSAYGPVIEALVEKRHAAALPALAALLADERTAGRNDLRVCEIAIDALAALDPNGPGTGGGSRVSTGLLEPLRGAWRAYLETKADGGIRKAANPLRAKLAGCLLDLIEALARTPPGEGPASWSPPPASAWVCQAQRCLDHLPRQQREELAARLEKWLVPVTRKEIGYLLGLLQQSERQEEGLPSEERGAFEKGVRYFLKARDSSRLDAQGRLRDLWGNPYRYHNPARTTNARIEIYSCGPNGKDERGKGDDIVGVLR